MTRQTSIDAYNEIKENGLLSGRQLAALDILVRHGPLTSNQVWDIFKRENGTEISSQGVGSRLPELRDMGVIREAGTTKDPFSGMTVILWEVTGDLPDKSGRKKSDSLKKEIEQLRAELATMRSRLEILTTSIEMVKSNQKGQLSLW